MAVRTTTTLVQAILGGTKGVSNWDGETDVSPYMTIASSIVDRLVTAATNKIPSVTISDAEAEIIERWLSAHFYTKMDPTYSSKSTLGASASFIRGTKEPEPYKDGAINADPSG